MASGGRKSPDWRIIRAPTPPLAIKREKLVANFQHRVCTAAMQTSEWAVEPATRFKGLQRLHAIKHIENRRRSGSRRWATIELARRDRVRKAMPPPKRRGECNPTAALQATTVQVAGEPVAEPPLRRVSSSAELWSKSSCSSNFSDCETASSPSASSQEIFARPVRRVPSVEAPRRRDRRGGFPE